MKSRPHSHFHRLLLLAASAAGIAGSQQPPYLLPSASTAWQKLRGTGNFVPRSGGEKPRGICSGKDCLGRLPLTRGCVRGWGGELAGGGGGSPAGAEPGGAGAAALPERRERTRPGREPGTRSRRCLAGCSLGSEVRWLYIVFVPPHGYPGCQGRAAALTRAEARGCGSAPCARTEPELNGGICSFTLSIHHVLCKLLLGGWGRSETERGRGKLTPGETALFRRRTPSLRCRRAPRRPRRLKHLPPARSIAQPPSPRRCGSGVIYPHH